MKAACNWAFLVLLLSMVSAWGIFMRVETERVPISRALKNLEIKYSANTNNVETLYELARVHSMAYATNLAEVDIDTRDHTSVIRWSGSDGLPHQVYPAETATTKATALGHLAKAITYYRRATKLVLASTNKNDQWLILPIHLGYAWCLDQAQRRDEAINAYRAALKLSWAREGKTEHLGPGVCYSAEIIGYLLKDLDARKDAVEIADLKAKAEKLKTMSRAITPILVPLADNLAFNELVNSNAGVAFDLDGTGTAKSWGWITPKAAWLVYNDQTPGQITSGLQMFGNVTFWIFWKDGYDALSSLDDNGDGILSGDELHGLALWQDQNGNGICDPGELKPLSEFGIVGIRCSSRQDSTGMYFNPAGILLSNGTTRPTYDWMVPSVSTQGAVLP